MMKKLPFLNACLVFLVVLAVINGILTVIIGEPLNSMAMAAASQIIYNIFLFIQSWIIYPLAAVITALVIAPLFDRFKEKSLRFHYWVFVVAIVLVSLEIHFAIGTSPRF